MIQINNLSLTLGTHSVFNDINLMLSSGQHIGVVGRNGAGKSTLLKVISGHIKPDKGTICIEKDTKIAYMPQDITLASTKSIFEEACTVFQHYLNTEQEAALLENQLSEESGNGTLVEKYLFLLEELKSFDKSKALAKVEMILKGLGFKHEEFAHPVSSLSVGWKMRLILAQLLLQDADFYLFDEPTNHLDIVTQSWFFNFIKYASFGFLLVSHDRYFLEGACNTTIELENKKATCYNGNFTQYLYQKEKQQEVVRAAYERQQKDIGSKKATIERFRASATKAKMAQSMIKQLEKIELIEIEPPLPVLTLRFPEVVRAGSTILSVINLEQRFKDKPVFKNVNFTINRGEKVALIAPNGTGKTTLFNTIIGKYVQQSGTIKFGHNVDYTYFEQDQLQALSLNKTIFEEALSKSFNIHESVVRSFLGAFLFSGDDIYKPISVLSGGEKNRVAMVIMLLQKANFLLLDEPTNHLDLYSKDALAQALKKYPGTLLIVSHDHSFLDTVATRVLELRTDEIIDFPGSYTEYQDYKKMFEKNLNKNKNKDGDNDFYNADAKPSKKDNHNQNAYEARKELKLIESKIKKIENKIALINSKFTLYIYGSQDYNKLCKQLQEAQNELAAINSKWEELFMLLER